MIDGAALQMAMIYGFKAAGRWSNRRGENLLDGGAPFYDTYECADGKFVAVGALEPQFFAQLLESCGLNDSLLKAQEDASSWSASRDTLTALFKTRTRDEWCELTLGTDACLSPVLDLDEAPCHPHNSARHTFLTVDGIVQPAPAPRFSRTVPELQLKHIDAPFP
jgi:alpha-methylacyl-CoA racemase